MLTELSVNRVYKGICILINILGNWRVNNSSLKNLINKNDDLNNSESNGIIVKILSNKLDLN